ncbi:hypothetical protein SFRURICE_005709 [Spodoptera frugiperda]|uniref:SFRICE_008825 n=1 Tax=Spodoptera frugiperda TaxID=7108 RepID=A0A2H1WEY1_SPOFR|nr:hypothetical protein SFRURICE_005709 [Spodoptera frugiperda]
MKTLTVVLVVIVFGIQISGYLIQVPTAPPVLFRDPVPSQWLHLQKLVIPLFENVCEDSTDPVIQKLAQDFTINPADYLEPNAITNLQKLMSAGLLPKGEIFSEYNPEHMKQLKIVYEAFYSAKNFDAFYKVAAWARQNVNCGLYVNAMYMVIQSRKDMAKLSIPAPYEVLPNYFVRKDVLIKATSILSGQEVTPTEGLRDEGNTYYLDANYTGIFYNNEDDSKLAYFREDIGLNSYYYLRKLRLSPWFNSDINDRYGENIYQMMKQFGARYNLERYANGFPEIDGIDWNSLPDIPYDPELLYSDGKEFNHRTMPLEFPVNDEITLLQTIENNVATVVSHMRQSGYNKTQILNHLMEILVTGERSYETLARQLLGKDRTNNGHVSVLEHYMTSLRDPMFWKINKKIVDLVDSALKLLPTYSRNELYFPGVEIVNIDVKKMMTACDYFEFDVTDALKLDDSKSTFNVKIGQPRLNHKPFTVKLNISSLVTKKGLVKIYLGPKLSPGELAAKKNLFTLLDVFEVNLKVGTNVISRTSDDMQHFSSDFVSVKTIRKNIEDAEFGLNSLPLKRIEEQIGYPTRLILPKGLTQGLPIQIFVFIAPFTKASVSSSYSASNAEFNSAILSPGYPLDLLVEDKQLFGLPNALIKYVTITQKSDSKVENYGGPGVTKQWYGTNTYDPSARPNYSANTRKSFDYNAKKGPTNNEIDENGVSEYDIASENSFNYREEPSEGSFVPKGLNDHNTNVDTVRSLNFMKFDTVLNNNVDLTKLEKKDETDKQLDTDKYTTVKYDEIDSETVVPEKKDVDSDIENKEQEKLTMPRLLKSSQYDYASKSKYKESFDYKAKNAKFDKTDYTSKRVDYKKYNSYKPPVEEENLIATTSAPLVKEDAVNDEEIIDTYQPTIEDYASKRKEHYDYKAKKAQFDRKDYTSKRGDYKKYHSPTLLEVQILDAITSGSLIKDFDDEDKLDILLDKSAYQPKIEDYAAKRKENYDYKAKKAQFDRKDYTSKRGDYKKYHSTTLPVEEEILDATTSASLIKDDYVDDEDKLDILLDKPTYQRKIEDYAAKRKENYDYKAKKAQYEKKDYSAKRKDYNKYRLFNQEEDHVTTSASTLLKEDIISDEENIDILMDEPSYRAKNDYASKRKGQYDYKTKKAQFDKKNYSAKRAEYEKYRTALPKEEKFTTESVIIIPKDTNDIIARVQLEKDDNNLDFISEIKENNDDVSNKKDLNDLALKDVDANVIEIFDPFRLDVRRRTPTVYDFLFHTFDYDSPENKVYE